MMCRENRIHGLHLMPLEQITAAPVSCLRMSPGSSTPQSRPDSLEAAFEVENPLTFSTEFCLACLNDPSVIKP